MGNNLGSVSRSFRVFQGLLAVSLLGIAVLSWNIILEFPSNTKINGVSDITHLALLLSKVALKTLILLCGPQMFFLPNETFGFCDL